MSDTMKSLDHLSKLTENLGMHITISRSGDIRIERTQHGNTEHYSITTETVAGSKVWKVLFYDRYEHGKLHYIGVSRDEAIAVFEEKAPYGWIGDRR